MYNLVIPALTDKNLQFLWEIYTICKVQGTKGGSVLSQLEEEVFFSLGSAPGPAAYLPPWA